MDLVLKLQAPNGSSPPRYGATPGAYAQTCFPHAPDAPPCPHPDDGYTTFYSKQQLISDVPAVFTSVLVPFARAAGRDATTTVAGAIAIKEAAGGVVHVELPACTVEIHPNDESSVMRASQQPLKTDDGRARNNLQRNGHRKINHLVTVLIIRENR